MRFLPDAAGRVRVPGKGVASEPPVPADPAPHRFLSTRRHTIGPDSCFICGRPIPEGSPQRTREHVFPKWLLRQLGLAESTLTSINRQTIGYYQLTVPCCRTCNGVDFSAIEKRVQVAFSAGLDAVRRLDRRDLFLWLGKIYYGVVYAESLRRADVRDPASPPLVPEEHLESIRFHHFLLQAASGAVQ
ncbi:hypothetical protein ACIRCZ_19625 [Leifsonia sp. NPDC102414]|uniref:hypothetical protein n=1 Tax=Leifsonia sp. NPDC102414 TaxID=3364124 RepID=UPI00380CC673